MTNWTRIKIVLVGLIALGVFVGLLRIQSLEADRARLTTAVEQAGLDAAGLRAEAATLRRELAAGQAALVERERQAADLAAQTNELRRELEELYQNDKPCQTWADSPVPDPVYRRLRK